MPFECEPFFCKCLGQLLHQIHRAVLPTGATNSHSDVVAVIALQGHKPVCDEVLDLLLHLRHFFKFFQLSLDRRIPSGQWAQIVFVMRVGQHAHIKDIVGIHGNAALEAKRFKDKC